MTIQTRLRRLACALAVGLALTTLTAPAAIARPVIDPAYSGNTSQTSAAPGSEAQPAAPASEPVVVEAIDDGGLDWGSAAIGAGVACGFLVLCAAGLAVTSRRRLGVSR